MIPGMTSTQTTGQLHEFVVTSTASTRRRCDRSYTWTVLAMTAAGAEHQATTLHAAMAGNHRHPFVGEVAVTIDTVDGAPPADCPHHRAHEPFTYRWDGGRDCPACA